MSNAKEVLLLTKQEIILLKKVDWTRGLLVYIMGLPVISLILTLFIGHTSAFLGVLIIGVGFMNIFYAPRQFYFNKESQNEGTADSFVKARLLTLWLFNTIFLLLVPVMIIMNFEKDEIIVFTCYFIYCFGFVSTLDILLSSIIMKPRDLLGKKRSFSLSLSIGLVPLLPFPFVLLSVTHQIFIMKIFGLAGLITLVFTHMILNAAKRNIENKPEIPG